MPADLQELEAKLEWTFRNRDLLVRAITHKSFCAELRNWETSPDNEQLEFFGDSILGFVISEALITSFPGLKEGELSRAKNYLVSARWLHEVAQRLGLGKFLKLGRGEELGGGRGKLSLLANATEAVIAALYLDGGIAPARAFILKHIYTEPLSAGIETDYLNYKGKLWERAGAEKLPRPAYSVLQTEGPAHAPRFVVEVRIGNTLAGRGEGSSRKAAEQNAARSLLDSLDARVAAESGSSGAGNIVA